MNLRMVIKYWLEPTSSRASCKPSLRNSKTAGPQSMTVCRAGPAPTPVYAHSACAASAFISKSSG